MNASASALALTFTRLVLGGIALVHGLANAFGLFGGPGHEKLAAAIAARISAAPEVLAWVISIGQLVAGLALVLGVFARSAALLMLLLVVASAVALTKYDQFFVRDDGLEYPLALAALCLAVAAQGAGALRLQLGSRGER